MIDQFTHRLIYLIGAQQSIDELHDKYIEERYKRTMLGLSQQQRQEVCAHPEQHYPKFRERWEKDWEKKVNEANRCLKQQRMQQLMIRTILTSRLKGTGIQYRITHLDEKTRLTFALPKRKEATFTVTSPTTHQVETIVSTVINHRQQGIPLPSTARIAPRSIYGVWEDAG